MTDRSAKIRCHDCLQLNRVPLNKIRSKPKCGSCKAPLEVPEEPLWIRAEGFDSAVAQWAETLLVVFTAPLSVYCKIFDPLLLDLARDRSGKLKVLKIDIENDEPLARRFEIVETPTFIVYRNGVELIRVDGAPKEKSDLVKWVDNLIQATSA